MKFSSRPGGTPPLLAGLLACALACPSGGQADEWRVAPDLRLGVVYNDNLRLADGDEEEIDVAGARIDIGLLAEKRSATSTLRLRPRLRSDRYSDNRQEESDDQFLDFSLQNRGIRSRWGVGANFAREGVLRGGSDPIIDDEPDLENPGLEDPVRFDSRRRRTILRLLPSWSYQLSNLTEVGGSLGYSDVSFTPQQRGEALDFTDTILDGFVQRAISPTSRLRLSLFAADFTVDDINNDTRSYGTRARYERDLSEVYSFYFGAGFQYSEIEAGANNELDQSQSGGLLDIGINRRWEQTTLQAAAGRSIQASSTGFLSQVDQVRLSLNHKFSARWEGSTALRLQKNDSLDDDFPFNQRDYYELRTRLSHRLTRAWVVELSHAFSYLDWKDTPGTAKSNEVLLTVNYQPRGRAWSW